MATIPQSCADECHPPACLVCGHLVCLDHDIDAVYDGYLESVHDRCLIPAPRRPHQVFPVLALAVALILAGCSTRSLPGSSSSSSVSTRSTQPGISVAVPTSGSCHYVLDGQEPDERCTPGAKNPDVSQSTISATICVRGWTKTVRNVSVDTKRAVERAYGYAPGTFHGEIDHRIALSLGGSNDATNLWPEAGPIPNRKDGVEDQLRVKVCSGHMLLAAAQTAILHWQDFQGRN